jgi:hypothetical protein
MHSFYVSLRRYVLLVVEDPLMRLGNAVPAFPMTSEV